MEHVQLDALTLRVLKPDSKGLIFGLLWIGIVSATPDPRSITASVALQLDQRIDDVVETDLECLVLTHQQAYDVCSLVLQDLDVTTATLLPLLALTGKAVECTTLAVELLIVLLPAADCHLLQLHNGCVLCCAGFLT